MTTPRQLTYTLLLALASIPTQADPSQVTLDLTGVITSVDSPPTDHTFMVGQPVSGAVQIDFANETGVFPGGNPNTTIFAGIANYSLTLGPVTLRPIPLTPGSSSDVFAVLTDGGGGSADTLSILDQGFSSNPGGTGEFDDLDITLTDPTGMGFTTGSQTFDPSKFIVGFAFASGGIGFSGNNIGASVEARSVSVPEPGTLLLFATGLLALFALSRLRYNRSASEISALG